MKLALEKKKFRAWQDSNLQSPDPKSGALSIRPHTHYKYNEKNLNFKLISFIATNVEILL